MGRTIEQLAMDQGHSIVSRLNRNSSDGEWRDAANEGDVAIEFTEPTSAIQNMNRCIQLELPIVCGTTGWNDELDSILLRVEEKAGTLFYASNFSIGVNLFFALSSYASQVMSKYPAYRVTIDETHHIHKKDEPSGTAISLADKVLRSYDGLDAWALEPIDRPGALSITSHREGEVFGRHALSFTSDVDTITLEHDALTREGFAIGAIEAATWVRKKKGVYTMNDMLGIESLVFQK